MLPSTNVWLSTQDIDKGTIWFTEIIGRLKASNCGVLCITRENHQSPWIHFEAGGMVTGLRKTRVATILLDMDYPELKPPLNQFNALRLNRESALHLVKSFNNIDTERQIKPHVLERSFDKFWPELDSAYRLLFPDSHGAARDVLQPVHIVPKPTATILGPPPQKKNRHKGVPREDGPGLFDGGDE